MQDILTKLMTDHLIAICAVSAILLIAIVAWRLHFYRKQDIAPDHKAKQTQAENYSNLGNTCFINNELDKAHDYYVKALKINEQLEHKEPIAKNYISIGIILSKKGFPKQARSSWLRAREIFAEIELPEDIKKETVMLEELQQESSNSLICKIIPTCSFISSWTISIVGV